MAIPKQASEMVKQIIGTRRILQDSRVAGRPDRSMIRHIYFQLLNTVEPVRWMFQNDARQKAKFTMWLHFHGRMLTADRLIKCGARVLNDQWLLLKPGNNMQIGQLIMGKGDHTDTARLFRMVFTEAIHAI
ncbi:hypothetical protein H5410_020524 [Solanum commersonii]|uniref:Uncharacterized protein n=1 Tax=Solanum commersonii TaxID=4109 RepID=A0A9J5Z891_SOLCO|nr:hypothetical protein H5410_020524 [Solanum commersonii]